MKRLSGNKVKLAVVGVLLFVLGGSSTKADFTFGEPTNLGTNVNSSSCDDGLNISSDGLSIIFSSDRPNMSTWDLYMATRETIEEDWGPAVRLGSSLYVPFSDSYPSLSADGLELFYTAPYWQAGWTQFGGADLWVSKRSTVSNEWSAPINLGELVNTSFHDTEPSISADGLELYFSSDRPGGYGEWNIWVTKRQTRNDSWKEPVNLGPTINSGTEGTPNISTDGLVLLFGSGRTGGYGKGDIWLSRRKSKKDPWQEPVNLGSPVNDSGGQWGPCISPDGFTLYFTDSNKQPKYGCYDLWQAPIIPIVDFNGDGNVNADDLQIMIDNWGTSGTLCDIGPKPLGDGIVDVLDLMVLTEHIEPIDRTLIAHWELDQIEGDIARDSTVGDNDASIVGGPVWQPDSGKVGGALQFDGIDDYLSTPFILNPGNTSFSVTAWIMGGATGQVIVSQADVEGQSAIESGGTWLGISPSNGKLMTGLMEIFFGPLESESVVADEQWHHVGLVYDLTAMKRHLYVDGVEVAVDDSVVAGVQSTAGLYIGAGQTLEAPSFFSGLIDDVRIYNKALTPEEIAGLAQ
jgi:Tol biopolymer transport system component